MLFNNYTLFDLMWRICQTIMPAKMYLKLKYLVIFRRCLDLNNPKTFNEKIQWLKLYGYHPEYSVLADKFAMKKYVSDVFGDEMVIPTLGVWDDPNTIDFSSLPEQFVLKCNHDSGSIVLCKNKSLLDVESIRFKLRKAIKKNYYKDGMERPYRDIKRVIIAEPYLEDFERGEVIDYKVHNFNGEPKVILVCKNRFGEQGLTEDFYSTEWEHMNLKRPLHPNSDKPEMRPHELDLMLDISRKLSLDIPFLRTDFYIINHKLYLGEMTFYPSSGFVPFVPDSWDYTLGDWLSLPVSN